jgi:hypothetical protein
MMDSKVNKKYNPAIVPTSLIKACARGLQSGLDKGYKPKSYLDGDIDVYKNALYRHLLAYLEGYTVDAESGLDTLDHMVANIAILIELEKNRPRDTSGDVGLPTEIIKKIPLVNNTHYTNKELEEILAQRELGWRNKGE